MNCILYTQNHTHIYAYIHMFSRMLYVGAGGHLDPIHHFTNHAKSIVFVDMRSKLSLIRQYGEDPFAALSDPRVSYHFHTYLPDDFANISSHTPFDTLIVSGHYPHECVLSVLTTPFHFVGYSLTFYPKDIHELEACDEADPSHVMTQMMKWHADDVLLSHVVSYTFVDFQTGTRTTFSTYEEFHEKYKANKQLRAEVETDEKQIGYNEYNENSMCGVCGV